MFNSLTLPLKHLARNAIRGGFRGGWEYFRSRRIFSCLSFLSTDQAFEGVEVHILTGRSQLTMSLWMVASWAIATGLCWRFVFHDDGTLRRKDAHRIRELLPDCRVILSEESGQRMNSLLSTYPLCLRCRNLHPFGRRLFDFPAFSAADRFISIDTDVLFFRKPERLIAWLSELDPSCLFFQDFKDNSLLRDDEVRRLFGFRLTGNINAGLIAVPKSVLSLDLIEKCLVETDLFRGDVWYIEQTLFAVAASVCGRIELLPKEYVMSLERSTTIEAVARHYIGAVRHFFYSEGIPLVADRLSSLKKARRIESNEALSDRTV